MGEVLPVLDRLALAAAHLPGPGGEEGAVWYEVAAGDDGSVAVALGNVRDASVAERLRRAVAGLDPAAALECLDQHARAMPALVGSTALCLTLDPAGVVRWSAAGHTPPLVAGPDGVRYLDGGQGEPLGHPRSSGGGRGAAAGGNHRRAVLRRPADVLWPDRGGSGGDGGGAPAPARSGRAGPGPGRSRAATDHRTDPPARCSSPASCRHHSNNACRPTPGRLSAVRRAVARWSAQAALSDDATADLQLLLSEAITNAVEHAYRDAEAGEFVYSVRRRRDAGVRVVVQDFGRWRPPPDDPGYRGRGLAVIHNLAEEMSLDFSDHGTRIAFTVPSDPPPLGERPLKGTTQGWTPDR